MNMAPLGSLSILAPYLPLVAYTYYVELRKEVTILASNAWVVRRHSCANLPRLSRKSQLAILIPEITPFLYLLVTIRTEVVFIRLILGGWGF
jgi:hypothetical protein